VTGQRRSFFHRLRRFVRPRPAFVDGPVRRTLIAGAPGLLLGGSAPVRAKAQAEYSMWGFKLPITQALTRMADGKLAEHVSWLDFIPFGNHAAILAHSDQHDWSQRLQLMLDEVPSGARIYIPGRVNLERGLVGRKSITLYGDASRENFDNSWDRSTGGSQMLFRGENGDLLTFSASDDDNANMNVVLRDFILRGNRLRDDGRENADARSGRGLVLVGGRNHTTNLRVEVDNVHVAQAMGEGLVLMRTVFGGSLRNMFLHRNGRSGFVADARGGIGIGEMWLARLRCFQNGAVGVNDYERAGLVWRAGSLLASQISATQNAGAGVCVAGGPFRIDMLQTESNGIGASRPADRRQILIGAPDSGVVSGTITAISSAPVDGCQGAHIEIAGNTRNVRLDGFLGGVMGPDGKHVLRRAGSEGLDISHLVGAVSNLDQSSDFSTILSCRLLAETSAARRNVTGSGKRVAAWNPDRVVLSPGVGTYDAKSGAFTPGMNGLYNIAVAIPLQGLTAQHVSCDLYMRMASGTRTFSIGNVGALRQGAVGAYALAHSITLPLRQGDRFMLGFIVAGGSDSVGVDAAGTLSISS
jgi:hypothetical protein